MEQRILQLVNKLYPVEVKEVKQVTNLIFRCEDSFYARASRAKSLNQQVEEVFWTNYLFEHGVGVSPALPSRNGMLVEPVTLPEEKNLVLFKTAPGRHLPLEQWKPDILYHLGREMGKLHRLSKTYVRNNPIQHIPHWQQGEEYAFLDAIPEEQQTIRAGAAEILAEVRALPVTPDTYGLVHGDVWLENVLVTPDKKLTLVDFLDCEQHHLVWDLAIPLCSAVEFSFDGRGNILDYAKEITHALLEGYLLEHTLPQETIKQLPLFIRLKKFFEYCQMCSMEPEREQDIRILNLYRQNLESGYPNIFQDLF